MSRKSRRAKIFVKIYYHSLALHIIYPAYLIFSRRRKIAIAKIGKIKNRMEAIIKPTASLFSLFSVFSVSKTSITPERRKQRSLFESEIAELANGIFSEKRTRADFRRENVNPLWQPPKIKGNSGDSDEFAFSDREIARAVGQVATNAKSVDLGGHGRGQGQICGLYERFSMLNHSCVANARVDIKNDFRWAFR